MTDTEVLSSVDRALSQARRQTMLDRAVGYFSPQRAAQRMQAKMAMAIAGSWVSASHSDPAMKKWNPLIGDADADSLDDLKTITARSRDAYRNIPLARGAIRTNVTNVVGAGLLCRPSIDASSLGMTEEQANDWEVHVKREFDMWASSLHSDSAHENCFYSLQGLALSSHMLNGDVFGLTPMEETPGWPYRLKVQLVEGDRASTPHGLGHTTNLPEGRSIHGGIERDAQGRKVAVHFSKHHPGDQSSRGREWARYEIFGRKTGRINVIHLYDPDRIGQSRGVPYLAPVLKLLKQLGRYTDAELAAAVIAAMFTVFIKTESGIGFGGVGGPRPAASGPAASGQEQYELGSGAVLQLADNQDVSIANPTRPNQAFDPFVQAVLRQVGVALEIPFELLIKHFSSSYTAARASMQEAWRYFMARRAFFVRGFCQPVYELFLEDAVSLGRVDAPGFFSDDLRLRYAYTRAKWIGPPKGQINERLETESALRRVEGGISSLDHETAEANGGDWEQIHRQRVIEQRKREEDGLIPTIVPARETTPSQGGAP